MMSLMQMAYVVAVRRIFSSWRLELVLFLGMLLAVALMASGVIFSNLLAEAALRHALNEATPEEANFSVRVFSGQKAPPTTEGRMRHYASNLGFADARVASRVEEFLAEQSLLVETATFFFSGHPKLDLDNDVRPRGEIKFFSSLVAEDRVRLKEGRWPYAAGGSSPTAGPLEVVVDTLGEELLGLSVDGEMDIFPAASFEDPPVVPVKIVGVFERVDPEDDYWYRSDRTFSFHDNQWTIVPLFTSQNAILERVYRVYPRLYTDITWNYYLDRQSVKAGDVDDLLDTLLLVRYDVRTNLANSSSRIKLDQVLDGYKEQLLLARIPLYLILFLVIGILTYYLALIASLVVKSRAAEISMLKSRGATTPHVGLMAFIEGILLAIPSTALGPLVALAVVKTLGRVFFGLGGSEDLVEVPVVLSFQSYLLGGAGALLGVIVLTVSTLAAARQGMVEFRQMGARPPQAPFIHRYYLDILMLGLIALFWWQVQSRGAFLVRPLGSRGLEIDYSLLLGPALGLLAIGLLVMRFFPIVVGLVARLAEPVGPVWLVHGLRHVSRDPIVPGSLVVLLMFATALGVIGSAFSATLERNQEERALYAAGADLRIEHGGSSAPRQLQGISERFNRQADGLNFVDVAVEVQRTSGHVTTTGFSTSGTLLAIHAEDFAKVGWYRPDFAGGLTLEELTGLLAPKSKDNGAVSEGRPTDAQGPAKSNGFGDGILLPEDATGMLLYVQPGRPDNRMILRARMQDNRGYYFDTMFGQPGGGQGDLGLNFREWRELESDLRPIFRGGANSRAAQRFGQPQPPYRLLAIHIATRGGAPEPGALFLSDLKATGSNGPQPLESFQQVDGWQVIEDYSRPGLFALEPSESVAVSGEGGSLRFSWAAGSSGMRGVRAGEEMQPLPALVSREFMEVADAQVGDVRTLGMSTFSLPVEIKAVIDYFPTLVPEEKPFAVVDLETFTHRSNLHSLTATGGSNELWVSLSGDGPSTGEEAGAAAEDPRPQSDGATPDPDAVAAFLEGNGLRSRNTYVASDMVRERTEQPLVSAGWGALLVLMFLALVLASASGVMLFSFTDTRDRRTEFALLRTLGTSRRQLNGAVWFSLFLVTLCGVALGSVAGQVIGTSLLPLMEVAEEGARVTPPMTLEIDWFTLAVSYAILGSVTIGTVLWLIWYTSKMEVQQVLRIGEAG